MTKPPCACAPCPANAGKGCACGLFWFEGYAKKQPAAARIDQKPHCGVHDPKPVAGARSWG